MPRDCDCLALVFNSNLLLLLFLLLLLLLLYTVRLCAVVFPILAFSEEEVYVVGTNGRKVTVIAGLEHLGRTLETLVLRSHVIARMEGLDRLGRLRHLELYDNAIEALEELEHLPLLEVGEDVKWTAGVKRRTAGG